ncbi:MAG TPA: tetratricopeptide repeat protein [Candidatus Obscuribacter sp.]|nr:tetratricopeptide repeat protein [Candidatus Obscuribacter sp.]
MKKRVILGLSLAAVVAISSEAALLLPTYAQKAASPSQSMLNADPVKSWQLYLMAGNASLHKHDMARALYYFKLCEGCARKIPGQNGIDKLDASLKIIASVYNETRHYTEAAQYGRQVVELNKASHQPPGDIAVNLNALAKMLKKAGKYAESEQAYKEALAVLGPKLQASQDAATIHDNLGLVYQEEKQYDKAVAEHQSAYNLYRKLVGDGHKDTAYSQMNLAEAYMGLKDYAKAEPLLNSAKTTIEKTEGSSSVAMASLLDNIGMLYSRTDRLAEAEEMQRRAFVLIEKYHGHFSGDAAISLNNLATTYSLENKNDEAKRTAVEACAIATKVLGAHHPMTKRCINNLDAILGKGLKHAEATPVTNTTGEAPEQKPQEQVSGSK